jgi:hypothetical protein
MKVFLSWSGETSKSIAEALRDWLPNVIQAVDPWMSSEDIDKGSQWASELASLLNSVKVGIVCVTPDNQSAPSINFEAGALSRTVEKTMVCPYLIGMRASDLKWPLAQFQGSLANKDETYRLIATINKALDSQALLESKLANSFERWWPDLEAKINTVSTSKPATKAVRPTGDVLEEILTTVRELARRTPPPRLEIADAPSVASSNLVWVDAVKSVLGGTDAEQTVTPVTTSFTRQELQKALVSIKRWAEANSPRSQQLDDTSTQKSDTVEDHK